VKRIYLLQPWTECNTGYFFFFPSICLSRYLPPVHVVVPVHICCNLECNTGYFFPSLSRSHSAPVIDEFRDQKGNEVRTPFKFESNLGPVLHLSAEFFMNWFFILVYKIWFIKNYFFMVLRFEEDNDSLIGKNRN
jgi:hypothetical protein